MNTYLAWIYTNKDARLREVPVSERSDFGGLSVGNYPEARDAPSGV